MDRPIGRKVLKFDSRLWRLRVVVAAAPQIKEGARQRRRMWQPNGGGIIKMVEKKITRYDRRLGRRVLRFDSASGAEGCGIAPSER